METKRQKFFKSSIKKISQGDNGQKKLSKKVQDSTNSQRSSRRSSIVGSSDNTENTNTTYMNTEINESNKTVEIQLEDEDIKEDKENKNDEVKDNKLPTEISTEVKNLKEGENITIKDYYDSIVQVELELLEDESEEISDVATNQDNATVNTSEVFNIEDNLQEISENNKLPATHLQVKETEYEIVTEVNRYDQLHDLQQHDPIIQTCKDNNSFFYENLDDNVEPEKNTQQKLINIQIDKEKDSNTQEYIEEIVETEENIKEQESIIHNLKDKDTDARGFIQDNLKTVEKGKERNDNDGNFDVTDTGSNNILIENDKDKQFDSHEKLNPTIEPLPENEIDMLRRSLEDNNEDKDIPCSSEETEKRTKKRRRELNKSYVDFISDEEDFVWDSSSWKETGDESSSSGQEETKKKKKKKLTTEDGKVGDVGLRKKKINKRKVRKELRQKGASYIKKDGMIVREKVLKPNPCIGKKCGHKCDEINEEKRQGIFSYFWGLSPQRQKDWLVAMTSKQDIKRKRAKNSNYRLQTFNYFINDGEGRRQVCQKFIIKTLDITQRFIHYTCSTATHGIAKEDARGKTIPVNKTSDETKDVVKNFIKSLPAIPSHYCRKESTRLYLPVEYKNIKNLYRIYKLSQISKGSDFVNENLFREIFKKEFNIGFHVPKKDKCIKCLKYDGQNLEEVPELQEHLAEKKASKKRLEFHREIGKENPSILCTSFDLQKVLNTPHGESMVLYYSRKYAVFNLCFYESITRNGYCYVWGESEGKRGGNEVATILQKYVEDVDSRGVVKSLILYSDSCPGQNKNKIVLASLHNALLLSTNIETIQINYLLPGHTEMSVDSMHSTIESSIRHTIIWAPSQWTTVCQIARKDPKPYNVEALTHQDFKNYEDLSDRYFKGNLAGKISKIRIATFKKSSPNVMRIKYSMKEDAPEEKIAIISKPKAINPRYKSALPITKQKYNDLKKLCDSGSIPRIFHNEYLTLSNFNGKDVLIETDIEDEVEERE